MIDDPSRLPPSSASSRESGGHVKIATVPTGVCAILGPIKKVLLDYGATMLIASTSAPGRGCWGSWVTFVV
jgi:hypothetical protein